MQQKVLIVEDCDSTAALEIVLGKLAGVELVVIGNGRDASRFLQSEQTKLAAMVTDLHLPYVDGFELIKLVRSDSRYLDLPIVVLSGDSSPDTPERVRLLGANAFFAKPYSPVKVLETLEALLDDT
ncbi:MAG TPA: response regulator [Bryobacteraceae bacterium]|nr:response regulator [Bryobacteraceae bacterium]